MSILPIKTFVNLGKDIIAYNLYIWLRAVILFERISNGTKLRDINFLKSFVADTEYILKVHTNTQS